MNKLNEMFFFTLSSQKSCQALKPLNTRDMESKRGEGEEEEEEEGEEEEEKEKEDKVKKKTERRRRRGKKDYQ